MCNFIGYMLVYCSFDTYISQVIRHFMIYYCSHISHDYYMFGFVHVKIIMNPVMDLRLILTIIII